MIFFQRQKGKNNRVIDFEGCNLGAKALLILSRGLLAMVILLLILNLVFLILLLLLRLCVIDVLFGVLGHGEPFGPVPGDFVVLLAVGLVLIGNAHDERIVRIALAHQDIDGEKDLGHVHDRRPALAEHIQADGPAAVHVAVIDAGGEPDAGRPERIGCRKANVQPEVPALVDGAIGPVNARRPAEQIVAKHVGGAVGRWMLTDLLKLPLDPHYTAVKRCGEHWRRGR